MATGTITTSTTITDITGFCCIAETRYGSNGDNDGTPEWDVGSASGQTTGRMKWADNPDDGFDTGLLDAELATSPGGAEGIAFALQASPDSPLIFPDVTYGSIGNVLVRAAAQITSQVGWSNITVSYYKNGNPTETYRYGGTFKVSTTDENPTAQVLLTVVPDTASCSDGDGDMLASNIKTKRVGIKGTPTA
jgi:hypothetical protein